MTHICIIGAGIAGATLAAELVADHQVTMLEAEAQPGYHATGRSASFWHESYGGPAVQPLTAAGKATLAPFLSPRGSLYVAMEGEEALLDRLLADFAGSGVAFDRLDRAAVAAMVPGARPVLARGVLEASCQDIDVAGLHADALARAKRGGAALRTDARVTALARDGSGWRVTAGDETIDADLVVNAAGAWASAVAEMAGALPITVAPLRRTIVQVRIDRDVPADLPLVIDIAGSFYFKPSGPQHLWLSPHDEHPSPACDAAPEELDVATAIDRFETVVDARVLTVERKWAGLRSFAPDRLPIYGEDPRAPGFYWCAGQGGFGIQTAPAAARLLAALIRGTANPDAIDPTAFAPERFA